MTNMFSQRITSVCLVVVYFMCAVEGQTLTYNIDVTSTHDVTVTATPLTMQTGFTKDLTVNCTFVKVDESDFHALTSLILSKRDSYAEEFYEVATITSHSPKQVQNIHSMGADVKGQINFDDVSYISFQWRYPDSAAQGMYKCSAFGQDRSGHVMHSASQVEVTEQEADFHMYLDKMKAIDGDLDQCKKSQADMEKRVQELTSHLNEIQSRFDNSMTSNAAGSRTWNGHTYYISGREWQNVRVFQSRCRLYGGYLAEINNGAEYHFLFNWLHNEWKIGDFVALGATDENHEGTWTWMRSGKRMDYVNWAGAEPTGSGQNCLFTSRRWGGLIDDFCVYHNQFARFLCEVES